ncbi:FIST N-terminal domain-containing protein [Pseudomonas sp. UMAB-08]|uniref:FIST N-terminal domain-containing protein n=1 Tax=Pseudomonas sp. UMAB-08 TaxID=1365375 RepID=UPI001C58FEC8|nr:FIST N-terminal domain-containing protein [Pseudomonas sp. UMAB-08]
MESPGSIRRAQSFASDTREAVREFHAGVVQHDMALVLFFCSPTYDREIVAQEMARLFPGVDVVGCSTAGEIGPVGYCTDSITGVSFPGSDFVAVVGAIDHLQQLEAAKVMEFAQQQLQRLTIKAPGVADPSGFALLLTDGLSVREEPLTNALQRSLGKLPLIGGSAADALSFGHTYVYFDGAFHSDSAAVVLLSTPLPFKLFKIQHFVPTSKRLVVTAADPAHRVVKEINGLPAAEEYARYIGVEVSDLNPLSFAASPLVVVIGETSYVRAIQSANSDGSLTFFCAIEEGLVLRLAHGEDLVENLKQSFAAFNSEIGPPQLVLGFDCVLRRMEITLNDINDAVEDIFRSNNVTGFTTYGEQFRGVHVNQTLTGIAIGAALPEVRHA